MAKRAQAVDPALPSANALIEESLKLEDFKKKENERFKQHLKPINERLDEIEAQLFAILNAQGADKIATDAGTAYKSHLLNVGIDPEAIPYVDPETGQEHKGQEALLYYALDHSEKFGIDGLLIKPQMDAVKNFMEENDGRPPPGVKTSTYTRLNIRRS